MENDLKLRPEEIGKLPRYETLNKLQAYYESKQYKGRPDFWTGKSSDGGTRVPLRERAPCIIYPLPKASVKQAVRFTLGEGKFPSLKVEPIEAKDALAPGLVVDEELAESLTKLITELVTHGRLKAHLRTKMRRGLSEGTAVAVLSIRRGKLHVDLPHAKDCVATHEDGHDSPVTSLTWCYRFMKLVRSGDNKTLEKKPYYFQRVWNETHSLVYEDAEDKQDGQALKWKLDEEKSVAHGLGFCPVRWSRNFADENDNGPDGTSLYEGLLNEFDSLNFALSQRHRGLAYFGVPQAWEIGVGDGDGPTASGRTAAAVGSLGIMGEDGKVHTFSSATELKAAGYDPARAMGPDEIWRYRSEKVRIGLLETSGASFEVASKHVTDVSSRLLEVMGIVMVDVADMVGGGHDISARALTMLHAPMLALVDELRELWWLESLEPILSMALRMIAVLDPKGLLIPGAAQIHEKLQGFTVADESGKVTWHGPRIIASWGEHFPPSSAEKKEGVGVAKMAKESAFITQETAARAVAPYFAVEDIEAEVEKAKGEKDEEMAQMHEAMAAVKPDPKPKPPGAKGAQPPAGKPKPPKPAATNKPPAPKRKA